MGVAIPPMATGALVSNTYATCPSQGDKPEKLGLIPHIHAVRMVCVLKTRRGRMGMRRISWSAG